MNKFTSKMIRGVAAGFVIGSAMGAMSACLMKPKKNKFRKTAGKALDAVGTMMQNMSDWAF